MVQWPRLHTPNAEAEGPGSILGWGTRGDISQLKIPSATLRPVWPNKYSKGRETLFSLVWSGWGAERGGHCKMK